CEFFGNQPKLRCFFGVTLIMEGTGLSARIASLAFSIAAMSFLNRSEEATVPSCPVSDTTTGAVVPLCVVTPKMLPIQVVSSTFAPTPKPIQTTLLAVVTLEPESVPKAILVTPVVLFPRALRPIATLLSPVVSLRNASCPTAVLLLPVAWLMSASRPMAVLLPPVVLLERDRK